VVKSPLSDEQLAAWRAFLKAQATVLAALERELEAERGLPIAFYDVLVQLADAEGHLRMSDLAERVVLSRSGVTRLVDRMERRGLVERRQCPSDRRGTEAVLTDKGRQTLEDCWPVHARGVAEHFANHLDADEVAVITEALGRMGPPDIDPCPWTPADGREARAQR
jgi:DNA-binding MarR family transcriptional regulator